MTQQEIKTILMENGFDIGTKMLEEKIKKQRDIDSYIWFGILLFFVIIFVGYEHNKNYICNEYKYKELIRKQDSILTLQKNQLDTLVWYNEIGYKIK